MTAAYRVTVAERQDLIATTIICPDCDTELTLRIDTASPPNSCASCGHHFDASTTNAILALVRFHKEAQAAETISKKKIFRFETKEKNLES